MGPQYHKFPPPVADALRTAVYYTDIDLNPPKALKGYKEALKIAIELGMHPFSDEVLGIKLQVAMMLEKAGLVKAAIDVLERTKTESLNWVEESRKKKLLIEKELEEEKKKKKSGTEQPEKTDTIKIDDPEVLEAQRKIEELAQFEERQRDKALKKAVGMQIKLAELYSSEYIQDDKKAEAAQVAAVELCLKEMRRRHSMGLPVGVGSSTDSTAWLNLTEIATSFTELASTYTNQEKFGLAMPLYLRALDMIRTEEGDSPTCKQVVLLNDVASAMAGQAQRLNPTSQQRQQQQQQPVVSREQTIEAAKQWAQKAIDVAARIQPPTRDQDCDVSCVAATYNLGELAEMLNKRDEAGKRYTEAKSLAQGIGFEEGVAMAETALKRLSSSSK